MPHVFKKNIPTDFHIGQAVTTYDGKHGLVVLIDIAMNRIKLINLAKDTDWLNYETEEVLGEYSPQEIKEISKDDYNAATEGAFIRAKKEK